MKKTVYLSGCFDPLHEGHKFFFWKGQQLGKLYVGVMPDGYIRRRKGYEPLISQRERAINVFQTGYVDHLVLLSDDCLKSIQLIRELSPSIHCLGPGQYDKEWNWHLRLILKQTNPFIELVDIPPYKREENRSTLIRSLFQKKQTTK